MTRRDLDKLRASLDLKPHSSADIADVARLLDEVDVLRSALATALLFLDSGVHEGANVEKLRELLS